MIDPVDFVDELTNNQISLATGIPDSLLKELCLAIEEKTEINSIVAANEGAAIGIAIGHRIGTGDIPLVYMQNSGIGNAFNPLVSLCSEKVYGIPMLLIIGWRGEILESGEQIHDEPQHKLQGEITLDTLKLMGISFSVLSSTSDYKEHISHAVSEAKRLSAPFALVVKKNTFSKFQSEQESPTSQKELPSREMCISQILEVANPNSIFVVTTGMASRELYEIRNEKGTPHNSDFLTVGGMGHASSIAYGLAIAQPQKTVYCIDGDGAFLMHTGTISNVSNAKNIIHIVLNNGAHDSVGGQPTMAKNLQLHKIAKEFGFSNSSKIENLADLQSTLSANSNKQGSTFIEISCRTGHRETLGRPKETPKENLLDFINNLE